uniref:Uncharacterized protein n=1 Tax=Romanomermis culicivorax TaxID=13658 RepID=A0A915KPE9_ROMCU
MTVSSTFHETEATFFNDELTTSNYLPYNLVLSSPNARKFTSNSIFVFQTQINKLSLIAKKVTDKKN